MSEKLCLNIGEPIKYRKGFMKIRFESDGNLSLGIMLNISNMIIVIASIFEKDIKCYPQVYLHECLHEL